MFQTYLRVALFVAGLAGAVILFAFAFTAAAVVVFAMLLLVALFGRPARVQWWTVSQTGPNRPGAPIIIEHDPESLPRREP